MGKILKLAVIGFAAIILIFLLHYFGWSRPAENLVIKSLSSIQRAGQNLNHGVGDFYNSWIKKRDLLAENNDLKNQLEKSLVGQSKINALDDENVLLKKELDFTKTSNVKFAAAQIISGLSDNISRSVMINIGAKNGVVKGLAVVSDNGVMIGKISEVYDDFSKVLLLTDNKSKVAATIQNSDRTVGLIEGQFGLSFSMTNIPQDQDVKSGDLIVTSGLEGQIPKNLLIAQVENVSGAQSEIFKTATLKPIISFDKLSDVLVIIP